MAYNDEEGGLIESLKEDGIVDLDFEVHSIPECVSTEAMVNSWLADALMYELWMVSDGSSAHKIYYSDLPCPIGKFLYFKQIHIMKQVLGMTKANADCREEEVQNPRANLRGKRQEEERKFKRRAKYFLVTQLVAVMVFISLLGGSEIELDDNDDDLNYD